MSVDYWGHHSDAVNRLAATLTNVVMAAAMEILCDETGLQPPRPNRRQK
ncbi:hypothetical protein [Thioalkalivibrio sulfidiphilus]|nr:hypothetical protein [Thioalkalivibrio sulfidiphilus]